MTVVGPTQAPPADGLAVDFVVESDRAQLREIVQRCGTNDCGRTSARRRPRRVLAALKSTERLKGKTIVRVRP